MSAVEALGNVRERLSHEATALAPQVARAEQGGGQIISIEQKDREEKQSGEGLKAMQRP